MSPAPCFHPVNLPASYCSGHNPTYLLLKLVRVCLFVFVCFHLQSLVFFLCMVLIQVYICQDFLVLSCFICSSLFFVRQIMQKKKLFLYLNWLVYHNKMCLCDIKSCYSVKLTFLKKWERHIFITCSCILSHDIKDY